MLVVQPLLLWDPSQASLDGQIEWVGVDVTVGMIGVAPVELVYECPVYTSAVGMPICIVPMRSVSFTNWAVLNILLEWKRLKSL